MQEQGLVACDKKNGGCNGGWPSNALYFLRINGTASKLSYPYAGSKNSTCELSLFSTYQCPQATNENYPGSGNCTRLRQLLAQGPVASTIYVDTAFSQYKSGLFVNTQCPSNGTVNHGIVIVGFTKEPTTGKDAFILRNSWGTGWGDSGYMFIDSSQNTCGICNNFWYY